MVSGLAFPEWAWLKILSLSWQKCPVNGLVAWWAWQDLWHSKEHSMEPLNCLIAMPALNNRQPDTGACVLCLWGDLEDRQGSVTRLPLYHGSFMVARGRLWLTHSAADSSHALVYKLVTWPFWPQYLGCSQFTGVAHTSWAPECSQHAHVVSCNPQDKTRITLNGELIHANYVEFIIFSTPLPSLPTLSDLIPDGEIVHVTINNNARQDAVFWVWPRLLGGHRKGRVVLTGGSEDTSWLWRGQGGIKSLQEVSSVCANAQRWQYWGMAGHRGPVSSVYT